LFRPKTLLVWDSYRCHISGPVKERLKKYNVDSLVIPGGCTKFVQTLDVSANAPFKSKISEEYDAWQAKGTKTYTPKGNIRAATKTILCDWVVSSWKSLSKDLVIKSFIVCGQSLKTTPEDITCMKPGRPLEAGLSQLKEVYYKDHKDLEVGEAADEDDIEEDSDDEEILISHPIDEILSEEGTKKRTREEDCITQRNARRKIF
jgi:hypothetical protein